MRDDLATNMRLVAQALEQMIGNFPEQWIVLNPVWSDEHIVQPPPGAANGTGGEPSTGAVAEQERVPVRDPHT
jgi:hypothetical protein